MLEGLVFPIETEERACHIGFDLNDSHEAFWPENAADATTDELEMVGGVGRGLQVARLRAMRTATSTWRNGLLLLRWTLDNRLVRLLYCFSYTKSATISFEMLVIAGTCWEPGLLKVHDLPCKFDVFQVVVAPSFIKPESSLELTKIWYTVLYIDFRRRETFVYFSIIEGFSSDP